MAIGPLGVRCSAQNKFKDIYREAPLDAGIQQMWAEAAAIAASARKVEDRS